VTGFLGFLKNAWNKEPVIMVSCGIGLLATVLPFVSPITKYAGKINAAVPFNYPGNSLDYIVFPDFLNYILIFLCVSFAVPVRDDGNMPDIPAHPMEPKGNNLEWLKNF
ncbi:hypothetical protein NQD34_012321, partial [Periophthalmus magnuspinnatus]